MKIKELVGYLESLAPLSTQENYDNSGLLAGDKENEITAVLVSLDCTEAIVDEAISKGCNVIISHHPIVFKGLKKITGKNYVERTLIKAIKYDIALYAIHTNLDNYRFGVNYRIGQLLGLQNLRVLAPSSGNLNKLVTYVPDSKFAGVRDALFEVGAGHIGDYDSCSFVSSGKGSFRALDGTKPFVGNQNELHIEDEVRLEVIVPEYNLAKVVNKLKQVHPYEEVAYDLIALKNENHYLGSGMIGELPEVVDSLAFLKKIKHDFKCGTVRHTNLLQKQIKTIAFCGGSGSFLLQSAINSGADLYITGDFKYHEFFDAENKIVIADIGHYESEQFTIDLICDIIKKKFTTFAVHLTELNTNPVNYL